MGEMKRANAYEEESRIKDRFASTLVIAASIIAAVIAQAVCSDRRLCGTSADDP
jgi:hypothetical protein